MALWADNPATPEISGGLRQLTKIITAQRLKYLFDTPAKGGYASLPGSGR